jgi:hypothetical protein
MRSADFVVGSLACDGSFICMTCVYACLFVSPRYEGKISLLKGKLKRTEGVSERRKNWIESLQKDLDTEKRAYRHCANGSLQQWRQQQQ